MNVGQRLLLYFVASVLISVVFAPLIIKLLAKLKARQTVLKYVVQHKDKSGTPTMGGFIFLIPTLIFSLVEMSSLSVMALCLTLGFGLLGFLDDFIKISHERNLGLKAYQKIIGQLGLSAVAGYFVYKSVYVGQIVNAPFTGSQLDFAWGIIPFVMLVYIATTNSVNLTDGLDGLVGYSSIAYFIGFTIILVLTAFQANQSGNEAYAKELIGLTAFCVSMMGGLCGYVLFNNYPSKIMMGDTGSLALGAGITSVAVLSRNYFLIVTSGIMFVWSCISVIVQVIYFKITKKRIFLMSPFHHHLEMKGWHETRVVALYFVVTLVGGAISLLIMGAL